MNPDFEWILEDCLARLRAGGSLADCLRAYPAQAQALRPLLQASAHARQTARPQARPQAAAAGLERVLAAAAARTAAQENARGSAVLPVSKSRFSRYTVQIFTIMKTILFGKETSGMKFVLRLAIDLVVLLLFGSVLTVNASARALPGEPLYPVKRTWEEVRLAATLNDPARLQLQEQIQDLRLDEVREMTQKGKTGTVEFSGQVEAIHGDDWLVSGIRVKMAADTLVEGDPALGLNVTVRARVHNGGELTALQVRMRNADTIPAPAPAATATPAPTKTQAPTRAWTPTREATRTPQRTHEPEHPNCDHDGQHDGTLCTTQTPNAYQHENDDHQNQTGNQNGGHHDEGDHHDDNGHHDDHGEGGHH